MERKASQVEYDMDGNPTFNLGADLASANPAVYGRLQ